MVGDDGSVKGVRLADGSEVLSNIVLSNATAKVTLIDLLRSGVLPQSYVGKIKSVDYSSPVTKINGVLSLSISIEFDWFLKRNCIPSFPIHFSTVALNALPNFLADPHSQSERPAPHHRCTIHLNCEDSRMLDTAYQQGKQGLIPDR